MFETEFLIMCFNYLKLDAFRAMGQPNFNLYNPAVVATSAST